MQSTATERMILASLIMIATAGASAGDKLPSNVIEPVLGLRLDAGAKLDPLPDDVSALCSRDTDKWIYHESIFARAVDGATTYYVTSGYAKRRNPKKGYALYEPIVHGGLYAVTGNKCVDDPADESFEARDFKQTPLPVLQQLARDLSARLIRAAGGQDKLQAAIKNQRIDFDKLSPELQEAFRPYFGLGK